MIRIKSGGISGAGIEDSGKMPMWAFFAFLIGLGFQYLLIRNGGLSVTGIVGSIKNGLLMRYFENFIAIFKTFYKFFEIVIKIWNGFCLM